MKRKINKIFSMIIAAGFLFSGSQLMAANSDVVTSVTSKGLQFTITRSDASAATTVKYRTLDGSALGGVHFKHVAGELEFAAGETEKSVSVEQLLPKDIYTYGFVDREFSLVAWNDFSEPKSAKAVIKNQVESISLSERNYKISEYIEASYSHPATTDVKLLDDLSTSDTLFKKEYYYYNTIVKQHYKYKFYIETYGNSWGKGDYNYLGIFVDKNQCRCELNENAFDPNTIINNNKTGVKTNNIVNYRFWLGNTADSHSFPKANVENLQQEQYNMAYCTSSVKNEGYFTVEDSIHKIGICMDGQKKRTGGNFCFKYVTAKIHIYDYIAPTIKSLKINTESKYNVGDPMTIAVVFDELVFATNVTKAVTNRGEFAYAGGSGTNVLYFTGLANDNGSDKGMALVSIDGKVADLGGNVPEKFSVENNNVEIAGSVSAKFNNDQNYYEIYNLAQLVWFRNTVNAGNNGINAKIMADIDLTSACTYGWAPIGTDVNPYYGKFDGNGRVISGMNISSANNVGLFGIVGSASDKATICNLEVEGNVAGTENVGGLAGNVQNAEISNCTANVTVSGTTNVGGLVGYAKQASLSGLVNNGVVTGTGSSAKYVGGVCGYAENIVASNVTNNGDVVVSVSGKSEVDVLCGGICGYIKSGSVYNGVNTANVGYAIEMIQGHTAPSFLISHVGGIAGTIEKNAVLENCSNTGVNVTASQFAGGIVGENNGAVKNSTNQGTVASMTQYSGGIAGKNNSSIESCENKGNVESTNYAGGICGYADKSSVISKSGNNAEIFVETYAGGIAGYNAGTICICYNEQKSAITGKETIGGVTGYNEGKIENCYNNGSVKGRNKEVGGIAGANKATLSHCFSKGVVSGNVYVGAICGKNEAVSSTSICYYLGGSATDGNETAQNGNGSQNISNVTADAGATISATETQIEDGTVCYNLNEKSVEDNVIWLQTIGNGSYPRFSGARVLVTTDGDFANPALKEIELGNAKPNKAIYYQGEKIDLTGVTLIETYNDGLKVTIDAQEAFEKDLLAVVGFDSDNVGPNTVQVKYKKNTFDLSKIVVSQLRIEEISVVTDFKNVYNVNDALNLENGQIQVRYNSGRTETVNTDETATVAVSGFDSSKGGVVALTITYKPNYSFELESKSIQYNVEVVKKAKSLAFEDAKTVYVVGDDFGYEFGHIVVTYDDGTQENVPFEDASVTNFASTAEASVYVMVEYEEINETLEVQVVKDKTVKEMSVNYPRTIYYVGDEFDFATGSVFVKYNNLSTETLPLDKVAVSGFSSIKAVESQTIFVTYMDTVRTYQIEVKSVALENISVDGARVDYQINTSFDKSVGKLILTYNNGDEDEIPLSNSKIMFDGYDPTKLATNQEITVMYGGLYTSYYVNIICNHSDTIVEKADIVLPTCTVSGSHTEIFSCSICKSELNRISVVDTALGHKPAEAVKENEVVNGNKKSYDMVVYCSVDSVELHRHTFETVENVVKDTVYNTVTKTDTVCTEKVVTKTVTDTIRVTDTVYVTDTIYVTDTVYIDKGGDDFIAIDRVKVEMNAYPNPVKQTLCVQFDESVDIEMFNAQGAMVYKSQFSSDFHKVDVVDFPKGAYVVKASNGGTCRVVVQ